MSRLSGKIEISIFLGLIVILLFFILRPTSDTRENSTVFHTMVHMVSEGPESNIILKLDREGIYYINHGLKKGLNLEMLQKQLINQQVTVLHLKPSFISGLAPGAKTRYITELRFGEKVIYSEL